MCTGFRNAAAQHHCFMDAFLGGGAGDLVGRAPYVFDAASVSVARVRRTRASALTAAMFSCDRDRHPTAGPAYRPRHDPRRLHRRSQGREARAKVPSHLLHCRLDRRSTRTSPALGRACSRTARSASVISTTAGRAPAPLVRSSTPTFRAGSPVGFCRITPKMASRSCRSNCERLASREAKPRAHGSDAGQLVKRGP